MHHFFRKEIEMDDKEGQQKQIKANVAGSQIYFEVSRDSTSVVTLSE